MESNPIIGLTIRLEKYRANDIIPSIGSAKYLVLGYYDSLNIQEMKCWMDYSPGTKLYKSDWLSPATDPAIVTFYPVKLIFTSSFGSAFLAKNSEIWKNPKMLLKDHPCFTLVLLKLTDTFKECCEKKFAQNRSAQEGGNVTDSDMEEWKASHVEHEISPSSSLNNYILNEFLGLMEADTEIKQYANDTNCCVAPSIGYSDFCILMAGTGWCSALKLVERLHKLKLRNGKEFYPVLSTAYSVPVYSHEDQVRFKPDLFKGLKLSIRFNLVPGVELNAYLLGSGRTGKVSVTRTSGSSDYCVTCDDPSIESDLLNTFVFDNRFPVLDISTTIEMSNELTEDNECENSIDRSEHGEKVCSKHNEKEECLQFKETITKLEKTIDLYGRQLKEQKHSLRQFNSLLELTSRVKDVCLQQHTSILRDIMNNLLKCFEWCLSRCIKEMEFDSSKRTWGYDDVVYGVTDFCRIVDSFLNDLSRSDRLFMEQDKYNHVSVSSATSLLLAYNTWLNRFTRQVVKAVPSYNKDGQEAAYSFLVTSGGKDETITRIPFSFLLPEENGDTLFEMKPLITWMSELSLYDFSGSILRMVHECMHFCGPRLREQRSKYICKFISCVLANVIGEALFNWNDVCNRVEFCHTFFGNPGVSAETGEETQDLRQKLRAVHNQYLNNFKQEIKNYLISRFYKKPLEKREKNFLLKNVKHWLICVLTDTVMLYSRGQNQGQSEIDHPFTTYLYETLLKTYKGFYQECDNELVKRRISSAIFQLDANRHKMWKESNRPRFIDQNTMLHINTMCAMLLSQGNPVSTAEGTQFSDEYWSAFPLYAYRFSNIYDVVAVCAVIFSETFSDVMACRMLDATLSDYLLMHVYEIWNPERVFSEEMAITYRISATLYVCFDDYLECVDDSKHKKMNQKAVGELGYALSELEKHGVPSGRYRLDALINHYDQLLSGFDYEFVGKYLVDYLTKCVNHYKEKQIFEEMRSFASQFNQIRLLRIDPEQSGRKLGEDLLRMYYALINN